MPVSGFLVHASEAMGQKQPVAKMVSPVEPRDGDFSDLASLFLGQDEELADGGIPPGQVSQATDGNESGDDDVGD